MVVADVLGDVVHDTSVHANNRIESDHARSKAKCDQFAACSPSGPRASSSGAMRSCRTSGGHYELGVHAITDRLRVAAASDEPARAV